MKSKKHKKKENNDTFYMILIIIIGFGGIVFLVIINNSFNDLLGKTEFKITKEECRNETTFNPRFDEIKIEFGILMANYYTGRCDDGIKCFSHEQIGNIPEFKCQESNKTECFVLKKKIEDNRKEWINISDKTHIETCEQVEVEYMLVTTTLDKPECYIWYENNCGDDDILVYPKTIFEGDLTTEWLDENCECLPRFDKKSGCRYKCGEYFIEVLQ